VFDVTCTGDEELRETAAADGERRSAKPLPRQITARADVAVRLTRAMRGSRVLRLLSMYILTSLIAPRTGKDLPELAPALRPVTTDDNSGVSASAIKIVKRAPSDHLRRGPCCV
jgi:hypothetical protein